MKDLQREGRRATVKCSMLRGCEAIPVEVEAAIGAGMETTSILGMPDHDVLEARERVRCAVRAAGFAWPKARVIVNLAPSALKKHGTCFDLAIAVAILVATGQVDRRWAEGKTFVGELALDGRVRPVRGMYCHARYARAERAALVCAQEAEEAALACNALSIGNLAELCEDFELPALVAAQTSPKGRPEPDLADIPGHACAKRAMQVAVAGGHGLLLVAPPGSLASMLAARLTSLMPAMDGAEAEDAAAVWSAAGEDPSDALAGRRPFRAPHCSITAPGLVGGGNPVMPGEASLAHGGVLYLERIEEFPATALQQLRAPASEGEVRLARADGSLAMPARFQLVASAWPCPCGHLGVQHAECSCSERTIMAYRDRLCGPLRDRFEVMTALQSEATGTEERTAGSDSFRGAVEQAWERRSWRARIGEDPQGVRGLAESCKLDASEALRLEKALSSGCLTGCGVESILRVARTIADMDGRDAVRSDDIAEALALRVR